MSDKPFPVVTSKLYLENYPFEVQEFYRENGKLKNRFNDYVPENFFPLPPGLCAFDGVIKDALSCTMDELDSCGIPEDEVSKYDLIWLGSMRPATKEEILEVMYGS